MVKEIFTHINRKVGELLSGVSCGRIGLPDLQRPFVWSDSTVRNLLDSMQKGFPIGYIARGVGKFISGAQINIGYIVQDPRHHQMKMLARAVSDAKEKAMIMAEAAECIMGRVMNINYRYSNVYVYSQARNIHDSKEAFASTADLLDITPDDLVMSDTVDVTFELITP